MDSKKPVARVANIQLFKVVYLTHSTTKQEKHTTGFKTEFFLAESLDDCLEIAHNVGLIDQQDTLEIESIELLSRRLVVPNHVKGI